MKVLVTGSAGMLGRDLLVALEARGHVPIGLSRRELDVTDRAAVAAVMASTRPDVVIHAAAFTNVDACETEGDTAFRVNGLATQNVALACQFQDVPLAYISSDYVFDGRSRRPYLEIDAPGPLGVYGQSKLAGEQATLQLLRKFYIIRTSWVYGRHGKNFVDTMRRLGRTQSELAVVADQVGSPTWTVPLAITITDLIGSGRYGIYQATGSGQTTWQAFAQRILALEGLEVPVKPLTTAELGRPAPRPAYSVMSNRNLVLAGFSALPPWEESLASYLAANPFGDDGDSARRGDAAGAGSAARITSQ